MTMTSIGDLAQSLMLRARGAELKTALADLGAELSSGRTSDIVGRLGGDLSHLADIDRTLRQLDGFGAATRETALMADAAQSALGRLHDLASDLGTGLIGIGPSSSPAARRHAALQAQGGLESALGALNLRDIKILELLYQNPNKVLDRNALFNVCWGVDYAPNSRALDQHISQLRKKVERDPRAPEIICTVHGAGYRYDPPQIQ